MIILDLWMDSPLVIGATAVLFIFLDLNLTRFGFQLRHQGYTKYFIDSIYELNPLLQDSIHKKKSLGKKVVLWIGLVVMITHLAFIYKEDFELGYGIVFLGYTGVILRHIENIFILRMVKKHPEYLDGQIKISIEYQYDLIRIQEIIYGFIWFIIFILVGRIFFLGGVIMSGIAIIGTSFWKRNALQRLTKE